MSGGQQITSSFLLQGLAERRGYTLGAKRATWSIGKTGGSEKNWLP